MTQETSITNLHMYIVTQNPIQGRRTEFMEQAAKSQTAIILHDMKEKTSLSWR